jgi:cytochrome b involved in lipid metabolism
MKIVLLLVGIMVIAGCQAIPEADSVIETLPPEPTTPGAPIINESDLFEDIVPADVIARAELAQHNSQESCWVAYQGEVYDVTDWLGRHPGGAQAILPHCGTAEQFEQAFTRQHRTMNVPVLRSEGIFKGELEQ